MIWVSLTFLIALGVAVFLLRKVVANDWRALGRTCLSNEGLKFFAFCGATGAGMALTVYLIWNTQFLHEHKKTDYVFYLAVGSMTLLGLTQLSLHRLLGAKQAIEIEFWKLKAKLSQGDDAPPTIERTVTRSVEEKTTVAEEPFAPGSGS